jgi:hypothetical protein
MKITAREVGKLMLVVKAFKAGVYLGKTTIFESEGTSVAELKARTKLHFSIRSEVGLFTNTMELDDLRTLTQNGIIEDSRLALLPKGESKMFLDGLIPNLTPWRLLKSGLNLEGTCENESCPAFSQRVVISLGFGLFTLGEELQFHYACPICQCTVTSYSMLGLFNCSAVFDKATRNPSAFEGMDCSTHTYTKAKLDNWRGSVVQVGQRGCLGNRVS